jgi:hypothetical protein
MATCMDALCASIRKMGTELKLQPLRNIDMLHRGFGRVQRMGDSLLQILSYGEE